MKPQESIIALYKQRADHAHMEIATYASLSNRYSVIRLIIFMVAIPVIYFVIKTNIYVALVSFLLLSALFVWAVIKQQHYEMRQQEYKAKLAINENEIACLTTYQNIYDNGEAFNVQNHAFADDLDVFGAHSIYALINRCKTYFGTRELSSYFLQKPSLAIVNQRQDAIREMAEDLEWRQELAARLYPLADEENNVSDIIDRQLSMDLSFANGHILTAYRKSLPFLWIGIAMLYMYDSNIANTIGGLLFLANLAITGKYTQKITEMQGRLSAASQSLRRYIDVLRILFVKSWQSPLLRDRSSAFELNASDLPIDALARLSTLIDRLDYRLNLLAAITLNGLILWDLRIIHQLSEWKKKNDGKIDQIFAHIGFIECISSLATWAYNHPQHCYPALTEDFVRIDAKGLSHPLIPAEQNVANDFEIAPTDEVIIITGSNMSGKSTLLRTLGLNMILGYTGTKVAAAALKMPIVTIVTYMRIKDALEENVSTFKAELNRISMILSVIESTPDAFILIDEMLRGTNSKDKLNGSIGITKKLLASSAYAMIATHDIKLAELGAEEPRIANYYFDIDYQDGDLVFDYKVKPGICENFNASFLLNQLGIKTETQ